LYWRTRVQKIVPPSDPTPSQAWGIACEAAIRSGGCPSTIRHIPSTALNADGHRKGSAWINYRDSQPAGAELLTSPEIEDRYGKWGCYTQVLANLRSHEAANSLLFGRLKHDWNVQIFWECPRTEVGRKAELDLVLWRPQLVVDVKTAQDPEPYPFRWACKRYCYDVQAVTYLEAIEALTGKTGWRFVWVVIRNSPPYDVYVYEDTPRFLAFGRWRADTWLDELLQRYETDNWFPQGWGKTIPLEMPD